MDEIAAKLVSLNHRAEEKPLQPAAAGRSRRGNGRRPAPGVRYACGQTGATAPIRLTPATTSE